MFKNNITEYIYAAGAKAPVPEGLHTFKNDVVECIDKLGLHVPVMGSLNSFKLYSETICLYSIILCTYNKLRSANSYHTL